MRTPTHQEPPRGGKGTRMVSILAVASGLVLAGVGINAMEATGSGNAAPPPITVGASLTLAPEVADQLQSTNRDEGKLDLRLAPAALVPKVATQAGLDGSQSGQALVVTQRYPALNGMSCFLLYVADASTGRLVTSEPERTGCAPADVIPAVDLSSQQLGARDFVLGTVPAAATSIAAAGASYKLDGPITSGTRSFIIAVPSTGTKVDVLQDSEVIGSLTPASSN